jgi:hypothetical protein
VLLFTGGAGSWKRRLVAGDAEVEPEDGPCSVRGFMGPDILSARDRGTGRRGLGRGARFGEEVLLCWIWASAVTSWLLCSWALGVLVLCRRQVEGGRAMREVGRRDGEEVLAT